MIGRALIIVGVVIVTVCLLYWWIEQPDLPPKVDENDDFRNS